MKALIKKILPPPARRAVGKLVRGERVRDDARHGRPIDGHPATLDCRIAYNRFGGYCVPNGGLERPAVQAVLNGLVWEEDTIEFMRERGRRGDVVHAGTYFGDFLPGLARGIGPDRNVWAFEPNPESHRCARLTVALNGLENVRLMHAGLGDRETMLPIATADREGKALGGASTLVASHDREVATVDVPVVTIDSAVPSDRHVAVLQLDVEGFEEPALRGALGTLRRCRPILLLENVPRGEWFDRTILSLGYREVGTLHDNTVFRCDDSATDERA